MDFLNVIGRRLSRALSKPRASSTVLTTCRPGDLAATLKPGDVLLVDGNSTFSIAIKYLTQSSWSHAALCIGDALGPAEKGGEALTLLDVDINDGVRAVPLSLYADYHTRICRPVGLSRKQIKMVIDYTLARLGQQYDLKNIYDLTRYLIPITLIPTRWRRSLLTMGSGDPTRAICSSLIAQAFQSISYPILPLVALEQGYDRHCKSCYKEVLRRRHHSQFTPRDFDVSPYFEIIKPTLAKGFKPSKLTWGIDPNEETRQEETATELG
ncbi:MAG: lipo-like protein [Desulfuromonadales bacterium]|nr:lipo-like protein [Desulfuromonadales bacterium]